VEKRLFKKTNNIDGTLECKKKEYRSGLMVYEKWNRISCFSKLPSMTIRISCAFVKQDGYSFNEHHKKTLKSGKDQSF